MWIWCLKWELFHMLLPLLRHMVLFNHRNCHLSKPVIKGTFAHDPLLQTFDIGMFKWGKSNSTTIKHIYNESADFIESYMLLILTSVGDWILLKWCFGVIGMVGMVSHAHLHYNEGTWHHAYVVKLRHLRILANFRPDLDLNFKVKYGLYCISAKNGPITKKWKANISVECYASNVSNGIDLGHDLYFEFKIK